MRKRARSVSITTTTLFAASLFSFVPLSAQQSDKNPRAWMNEVRIGAYGLSSSNAAQIVQKATSSGVYGIEVDNDIPGRYESFVNPTAKLHAIHHVAKLAHA